MILFTLGLARAELISGFGRYVPGRPLKPYVFWSRAVGSEKGAEECQFLKMRMLGEYDHSVFDTLEHHKHRARREPWGPYFSKASVSKLHPLLIQPTIIKFIDRLTEIQTAGRNVNVDYAYSCLTADIISEYSFPQGYGLLDKRPESLFYRTHYDSLLALSKMSHVFSHFGWLFPILNHMPLSLVKSVSPAAYAVTKEQQVLLVHSRAIAAQLDSEKKIDHKETTGRPSMIEAFMTSRTLPPQDKLPERISKEAYVAIAAGTITSAHMLKAATYHLLANPPILSRLLSDMEAAIPDIVGHPPDLRTLESIDYLMAVIYETLRIFYGNAHRLSRIFPDRPIIYKGKGLRQEDVVIEIPPGNPVSMSGMDVHQDESIFPDHYTFNPDRWLPLQTNGVRLQKYLMTFGKGSRSCELLFSFPSVWFPFAIIHHFTGLLALHHPCSIF